VPASKTTTVSSNKFPKYCGPVVLSSFKRLISACTPTAVCSPPSFQNPTLIIPRSEWRLRAASATPSWMALFFGHLRKCIRGRGGHVDAGSLLQSWVTEHRLFHQAVCRDIYFPVSTGGESVRGESEGAKRQQRIGAMAPHSQRHPSPVQSHTLALIHHHLSITTRADVFFLPASHSTLPLLACSLSCGSSNLNRLSHLSRLERHIHSAGHDIIHSFLPLITSETNINPASPLRTGTFARAALISAATALYVRGTRVCVLLCCN